MKFPIRLISGKKKQETLIEVDLGVALDIRKVVKDALKLQVPRRCIFLCKQENEKTPTRSMSNDGIDTQLKYDDHYFRNLISQLRFNDALYVSIIQFEIGMYGLWFRLKEFLFTSSSEGNYICTGDELGSGSFSQVRYY